MTSRNIMRANQQARSNAKAAYSLDRELYSQMIDDAYNNALKDIGTFRATIVSIKNKYLVSESAGKRRLTIQDGFKPANFYEVYVRPEWLNHIPAPWKMRDFGLSQGGNGLIIKGKAASDAVKAHPEARSVTPTGAGIDGISLKVGDIVVCTFGDGPDNSGKYRDIRFELNSVGEDEDLIIAAGGKGAYNALKKSLQKTIGDGKKTSSSGQGETQRTNQGATILATGDISDPSTLRWRGYHMLKNKATGKKERTETTSKPEKRKYIGSAVPSAQGEYLYNGVLEDKFFGTITLEKGRYDHSKSPPTLTLEKPRTYKILLDALPSLQQVVAAYREEFKCDPPITSVNRPWTRQLDAKGGVNGYSGDGMMSARPGYSPHGWGVAIDFTTKNTKYVQNNKKGFDSSTHQWMKKNAYKWGWVNPAWAVTSGWIEPWHFEWRWMGTAIEGLDKKDRSSHYEDEIPDEYKVKPT